MSDNNYFIKHTNQNKGQLAISVAGVQIWNGLPKHTKETPLVHVQNFGGVACRVPRGWRDKERKPNILVGWVTIFF